MSSMNIAKPSAKILFVTRGRSSRGGHVVLVNIVRELRKEGYDVTLTVFESKKQMKKVVPYWESMDVNFVEIPHLKERNSEQIEHVKAISKYIRENVDSFDKIILDSWITALAVAREYIFSDKIWQLVQSDPLFVPENESVFWKAELLGLLPLTPMNRIIVSETLAKHLSKRYKKKFEYLSLFLDENYLKCKFDVGESEILKIVSSSATFNIPTKGLDFLLDQLKKIKDFKFELTLISGEKIEKDLSEYPFPIKITSTKNSLEMAQELCKHDVYANTSTKESFCLALAEAIAIGMPAIALDSIGNREYMDGNNAIFVDNPKDFITGLLKMKDVKFRKGLNVKARESMKKYKIKNTIKEFKKIIEI